MPETPSPSAPEAPLATVRTPAPRARSGTGGLALLLAFVAIAAAGYALWRDFEFSRTSGVALREATGAARAQADRVAALERDLSTATQLARAQERKLADAENLNRSLREEVLGLGERAGLLEDAVASLADRRQSGAVVLKLDEASYLLRLGQVRLTLFNDPASAIAALRLADAQLAELDDALLAGVRQTIATEIQALSEVPVPDRAGLAARIDSVIDALPRLPTRVEQAEAKQEPRADDGYAARLGAVLGQFVRVRRTEGGDAALVNPLNVQAVRAAIALELQLAKAALAAGDDAGFTTAVRRARVRVERVFAPDAPGVGEAVATLAAMEETVVPGAMPELGRALDELTNLRATRALGAGAPAPTATPEPAPETTPLPTPEAPPAAEPESGDAAAPEPAGEPAATPEAALPEPEETMPEGEPDTTPDGATEHP